MAFMRASPRLRSLLSLPSLILLLSLLSSVQRVAINVAAISPSSSSSSTTGLYNTLGLSKDCNEKEIKKAYRKLALRHHPDKVPAKDRPKAEKKFKQIARAYEILSDEDKRKLYDQYGERSLDPNFNPMAAGAGFGNGFGSGPGSGGFGGAGGGPQSFHFSNQYGGGANNMGGGGGFSFGDIFSGNGPSGGGGVGGGMPIDLGDLLASMMGGRGSATSMPGGGASGSRGFADMFGSSGGEPAFGTGSQRGNSMRRRPPPKDGYTRTFRCTLEELLTGCTKKLKVTNPVFDPATGQTMQQDKIYTLDVKPGWKSGTKIKFKAKDGFPPITFVLAEKPHPFLKRKGDNLIWRCKLTESQARKGAKLKVPLPDGETLEISTQDKVPLGDGDTMTIRGRGMPLKGGVSQDRQNLNRGDLIIEFRVVSNVNSKQ